MIGSSFDWLDFDDRERRQMMEVIDLFREKGTLDELGIGTIRDALSDHFFPGTSTIQTRARYFLLIPWLYRLAEERRTPTSQIDAVTKDLQWRLVQSLKKGGVGANAGLIGIDAGQSLQRLPSGIYWNGLRRWGIALFRGSGEQYHGSLDTSYAESGKPQTSEGGELVRVARSNWHGALPSPPANFLEVTDFQLSLEEATFLVERILHTCPGSLLAACLKPTISRVRSARAPWDLGGLHTLNLQLQQDIEHARLFSLAMEGATLLYNLMLAELRVQDGVSAGNNGIDRYRRELDRWADEMRGSQPALVSWNRSDFWDQLHRMRHGLPPQAIRFSDAWMEQAIDDPEGVRNDKRLRLLLQNRERSLKGSLARLVNAHARERWSGASGLGRLTYRWTNARRILVDILDGLNQPPEAT